MFGPIGDALGGIGKAVGGIVENLDLDLETVVGLGMGIATGNPLQIGYYAMDVLDGEDDAIVGQFEQFMPLASLAMGNPAGAGGLQGLLGASEPGGLGQIFGLDVTELLAGSVQDSDAHDGFDLFATLLGSLRETEVLVFSQPIAA